MTYKKLLISLLLMPTLAFGADEPSQEFLDTLALAEQGDVDAQYNLGYMYDFGEGVPQNDIRAYAWYSVSAAQGDEDGGFNRDMIADGLTPSQLAQAQEQATRCFESDFQDCE